MLVHTVDENVQFKLPFCGAVFALKVFVCRKNFDSDLLATRRTDDLSHYHPANHHARLLHVHSLLVLSLQRCVLVLSTGFFYQYFRCCDKKQTLSLLPTINIEPQHIYGKVFGMVILSLRIQLGLME